MNPDEGRIQPDHLLRNAYIYVRQSTLLQVQIHQESTRRQYALRTLAHSLGWGEEQIEMVDDDLGQSASEIGRLRPGYERLLTGMVTGQVGAIFSVEISRLARQDSEGYRLVEVAALTGVLLIDEHKVYDPNQMDDRLMLGLKVLLSSNEIRQMNQRLRENKLRKAQRGKLRLSLPVGLVQDPHSGIGLDPNEEIQGALRLVFERYRLSQRLSGVVHYFHDHGLLIPRHRGNWNGPVEWAQLSIPRAHSILTNPLYAGAYVYGRTVRKPVVGPQRQIERKKRYLEPEEWGAVQWNAFPGYIDKSEYQANQAVLAANQLQPGIHRHSCRRDGPALLSGLILCGRCGKRMYVVYSGERSQHLTYTCNTRQTRYAEPCCQRIPGAGVDAEVVAEVLRSLSPAQIELSLAAVDELERQQSELVHQWQRRLENAHYAANLAQRRYEQVDPDNRLVARNLERGWEQSLQEVDQLEADFQTCRQQKALELTREQRSQLLGLSQDLPRLWTAPTTTFTERKTLLELLIADVTLTRRETTVQVQIRWHTNQVKELILPLPRVGSPPTPAPILERITALYQSHTDAEVADVLNREGIKTAAGNEFTTRSVGDTRRRNGIRKVPVSL